MIEGAVVEIKLADCAITFVAAALDLLVEVEEADEVLITDEVREAAAELRRIVDSGRW